MKFDGFTVIKNSFDTKNAIKLRPTWDVNDTKHAEEKELSDPYLKELSSPLKGGEMRI